MKMRTGHIVIALGFLLGLTACRKEMSKEDGVIVVGDGVFTAQIDGVTWTAADTAEGATLLSGLTNIIGVSADSKQLSIVLSDTVTGTYTLGATSKSSAIYSDNNSADAAYSSLQSSDTSLAGGTVTVTEIDKVNKTITGTFAFRLYRDVDGGEKKFTKGVFNKLPYIDSLPVVSKDDTMRVAIDGIDWSAQSILASSFSGQLSINGSNTNGAQSVSLVMPLSVTPGSYPLDYTQLTYFGLYSPVVSLGLASSSGTLQILENNATTRRVRGNFNFKAVNPQNTADQTHQLSNGYFSVQYN